MLPVGWRERDYARLREEELEALYGFRTPSRPRRTSTRQVVWVSVGALSVAVLGFGLTQRQHPPRPVPQPSVLYGQPVQFADEDGACVDYELDAYGHWACGEFDGNMQHLPVITPPQYEGPCTHLLADQSRGRWVCLSSRQT